MDFEKVKLIIQGLFSILPLIKRTVDAIDEAIPIAKAGQEKLKIVLEILNQTGDNIADEIKTAISKLTEIAIAWRVAFNKIFSKKVEEAAPVVPVENN